MGPPSACLQATLERALYPPLATRPLVPRSPKLPRHHDHDTVTRAPYRTSAKGRIAVPVDAQLVAAPACHTATAHAARDSSRQTSRQTSQRDRLAWRYPCRFPATHRSHLSHPPQDIIATTRVGRRPHRHAPITSIDASRRRLLAHGPPGRWTSSRGKRADPPHVATCASRRRDPSLWLAAPRRRLAHSFTASIHLLTPPPPAPAPARIPPAALAAPQRPLGHGAEAGRGGASRGEVSREETGHAPPSRQKGGARVLTGRGSTARGVRRARARGGRRPPYGGRPRRP